MRMDRGAVGGCDMSDSVAGQAAGERPKVLITGASGLVGRLTREHLSDKYDFSAVNRRPVDGIPCLQADVAHLDAIRPAFHGVESVLHLAAFTEDVQDWDGTMRVTVQGTLHVFRAAQAAGVKKVVFVSSGSTMCAYEWDEGSPYGMMARGEYDQVPDTWPMMTTPGRPARTARTPSASCSAKRADATSQTGSGSPCW